MRSLLKISLAIVLITLSILPLIVMAQDEAPTAEPSKIMLNADKVAAGIKPRGGDNVISAEEFLGDNFESDAKQAILIDFSSNSILYEKSSEERMFPSSMTKIVTMYLVFDQLRKGNITMDTEFTVSERGWKTGGSQMFLKVGDKVKVSELIQGVIVQSGNDACVTLAEGISGSVESFVEDMNTVVAQLGMKNTHFQNPDGLPTEGHYTTARDLAIAAERLIVDFPEHYHYYSQREFTYANITQHNRNKLLDVADLGVDGMKTGFTEMGGYGIIATGVKNNRRFIAIVNGLPSDKARMAAAASLLRYGYTNFRGQKLFNKFDVIGKVAVWAGADDFVNVATNSDIEILLNRKDSANKDYKVQIAYKEPVSAPIKKDTKLADLLVKNGKGETIAQFPLYAANDVAEAGIVKKLIQKAKALVHR